MFRVARLLCFAVLVLCGVEAFAQAQQCYVWLGAPGFSSADLNAACSSLAAGNGTSGWVARGGAGAPTGPNQYAYCNDSNGNLVASTNSTPGPCANVNNCSATSPTMSMASAVLSGTSTQPGLVCVNGCGYTNSAQSLTIGAPSGEFIQPTAIPTGQSCGAGVPGDTTPPGVPANCFQSGKEVLCAEGPTSASVNGDQISTTPAPPPGQCSGFKDGAIECTATPSVTPPAPMTGTGSGAVPETPAATVTASGGTITYYSPSQTAASSSSVPLTNTTTGTNVSGVQAGSGGAASAANGTGSSGTGAGAGGTAASAACVPSSQTTCGDAYSGGDDCSAPPSCTGDPVQCAQVMQIWQLRCRAGFDADQLTGAIGYSAADDPGASSVDVSSMVSETSVTGPGGSSWGAFTVSSGTCPAPIVISLNGQSLSLDIWKYPCQWAGYLSFVIMFTAYAIGARVFLTGVIANTL